MFDQISRVPGMAHFGDLAKEIYQRGLAGQRPDLPLTADGLEAAARHVLPAEALSYVAGGASTERTIAANREAFARWRIVPRMLRGVTERDLSTTVLGTPMTAPVLTAPIGVLGLVHPDADLAVARAAAALGLTSVLSTASSTTLEDVAAAAPDASRWFQLYWPRDPELAESLVRRAEAAGYRAIVLTVDTWSLGWRPRDLALAHQPFLQRKGIANYLSDPVFQARRRLANLIHQSGQFFGPQLFVGLAYQVGDADDFLKRLKQSRSRPAARLA